MFRRFFSSDLKVLSFYKLARVKKETLHILKQDLYARFNSLGVLGRIYISSEGLNAQISIPSRNQKKLEEFFEFYDPFQNMLFNESVSPATESFDKLIIKVKSQVLADGLDSNDYDINNQPKYLEPMEFHHDILSLLENPNSGILLDVRNGYEMQVGHFKGATLIETETFRESLPKFHQICREKNLDKKPILMYCTGGIRCSKAGAYLKSLGFADVRMLKGGITNYGNFIKTTQEESLFIGKNYTFDGRQGEEITQDLVGKCQICSQPTNELDNCIIEGCNKRILHCANCSAELKKCCSKRCVEILGSDDLRALVKQLGSEYFKISANRSG